MFQTKSPIKFISICILSILFFISTPLCAANLMIKVLQKGSGDPVIDAAVILEKSGEFTNSDENGIATFEDITLPEKLKILTPGYDTFFQDIESNTKELEVYIEPLIVEGESLEVVEERVVGKTSKVILQAEELRKAPGTQGDPLKAIQSLPGVVTAAEGTGLMYIRGSEPNQSITWVNRARIGYLYHFGGLHSTISPQLISDFNMFLGGFPVEYGGALGGALDVKLRQPRNDRWHQNYSIGTYESSAVIEGPIFEKNGKDSLYISGRRSYVDLVLDPESFSDVLSDEEDDEFKNAVTQVPEFYDVQAVWQHNIANGRFLLQHFSAKDQIKIQLNEPKATDPNAKGELASSVEYHSTSAVWEKQIRKNLHAVSSLYFIASSTKLKIGEDDQGNPFFLNIDEQDIFWQPEFKWQQTQSLQYTFGTEFVYASTPVDAYIGRPPGFNDIEYNLTETEKFRVMRTYRSGVVSPYIKFRKKWFKKFTTQLGFRYTYLTSNGRSTLSELSPRLTLEYELSKATSFNAVWGRYLQLPDGSAWVEDAGNPDLKFLESQHRIIGFKHQFNSVWSTQIEAYDKPMKNLVVTYDAPKPDNYKSDGTGRAYGFDILFKREFSAGKMGWLSYSYLKSTRTQKGETFAFSGDQRHTLSVVYGQPLWGSWKRWNVGFRARINSGKPYTRLLDRTARCRNADNNFEDCANHIDENPDANFSHWTPKWGPTNGSRLPLFYQLDVRIDREFLFNRWKMNIYLDMLNVLNTRNVSGYDYGNSLENSDNPQEQTSLGIFPSFGIEITI